MFMKCKIKEYVLNFINRLCCIFPIKSNKMVFSSFQGKYFNDSPKAIFDELRKECEDIECIWLMKNDSQIIKGAKVVKINSFMRIYHLATAKVWIDNSRKPIWTFKRKGQIYIQTWHGGFPFKKSEAEVEDKLPISYVEKAKHDSQICDYVLSGCFTNDLYLKNYFWFDKEIIKTGIPKTDIFYNDKEQFKRKVRTYYGVDENTRFILYAPTFREDRNVNNYDIEWNRVLEVLHKKYEGKWAIIIRLHPNMIEKANDILYDEQILDGSSFDDINELIMASSFVVTDYSSCLFDAIEARVPVLIYAKDYDSFCNERGLNYRFDELPVFFSDSTDTLCEAVKKYAPQKFLSEREAFLSRHGYYNDGMSSKRAVDFIISLI